MPKKPSPFSLVQAATLPPVLPEEQRLLFTEMIQGWQARRHGRQGHTPKSVQRDLTVIDDFHRFCELPPWLWNGDDFDGWCHHLGVERQLSSATQRHYQSAIRNFLAYLIENVRFRVEVRRRFGIEIQQICTVETCIPHTSEREATTERRAMSYEEFQAFFQAIDDAMLEAMKFRSKDFRPLQRDKALFFTIYAAGLRASEALGLDVDSFSPNPARPGLGPYGFASVWGKGSRGSGRRNRYVAILHADLKPILDWYLSDARPLMLLQADPNEKALWLSERGRRLALSTLEARFQMAINRAMLDGRDLTPHCLRHSFVTHVQLAGLSLEATRREVGHTHAATTQIYTHFPDDHIAGEMHRLIDAQMNAAKAKEPK